MSICRFFGMLHASENGVHDMLEDHLIYMMAGPHGDEALSEIFLRKGHEKNTAGMIWWGYGGTTLRPDRVRSFIQSAAIQNAPVLMSGTRSNPGNDGQSAAQYSLSGSGQWQPIPSGINVIGSNFALVFDTLEPVNLTLDLGEYDIFRMPHEHNHRPANTYIRSRVDKGCLVRSMRAGEHSYKSIILRAILKSPYAVYVR